MNINWGYCDESNYLVLILSLNPYKVFSFKSKKVVNMNLYRETDRVVNSKDFENDEKV